MDYSNYNESDIRNYRFYNASPVEFDSTKTVKELVDYVYMHNSEKRIFPMDSVTVFQMRSPKSPYGWLTTDLSRTCRKEIQNPHWLCFAYYVPQLFYFVEGGCGHYTKRLGNHPVFAHPVDVHVHLDDEKLSTDEIIVNGQENIKKVLQLAVPNHHFKVYEIVPL